MNYKHTLITDGRESFRHRKIGDVRMGAQKRQQICRARSSVAREHDGVQGLVSNLRMASQQLPRLDLSAQMSDELFAHHESAVRSKRDLVDDDGLRQLSQRRAPILSVLVPKRMITLLFNLERGCAA